MAKEIDKLCKTCIYWLASDRILDYGYCVKRDCYRPETLTCDRWQVRSGYLVKKEDDQ